jgi:hypothetical protein
VPFDEALGLAVADDPVEEVEGVLLVDGVPGDAEPVDDDGHCRQHCARGDGEVEVGGEGEERAAEPGSEEGQVPARAEGPVEVGRDAGVDGLVERHLLLVHLAHLLLAAQQLEREQFGVVVLGVGQRLGRGGSTSSPRWVRWRR